jgi:hypothetical protein
MEIFQISTGTFIKTNTLLFFHLEKKSFIVEIDQLLSMTTYSAKIKVCRFSYSANFMALLLLVFLALHGKQYGIGNEIIFLLA